MTMDITREKVAAAALILFIDDAGAYEYSATKTDREIADILVRIARELRAKAGATDDGQMRRSQSLGARAQRTVLRVPCTGCGVPAGTRCRTKLGVPIAPTNFPHEARLAAGGWYTPQPVPAVSA